MSRRCFDQTVVRNSAMTVLNRHYHKRLGPQIHFCSDVAQCYMCIDCRNTVCHPKHLRLENGFVV
jgi:hypothetical protein